MSQKKSKPTPKIAETDESDSSTAAEAEAASEDDDNENSEPLPSLQKRVSNHSIDTARTLSLKTKSTEERQNTPLRQFKTCTNKRLLIKNQQTLLHNAKTSKPKPKDPSKLFSDTTISLVETVASIKVELIPSNIISIPEALDSLNEVHSGKFLLCRTLTPPVEHHGTLVVVDDPESESKDMAMYLVLHNYIPEDTVDAAHILPPGSILAVKNPLCKKTSKGELVIYCENPIEIRIFSEKTAERLFPKVKWKTEIPIEYRPDSSSSITSKSKKKSGDDEKDDEYWKSLGNYLLKKYRYTAALEAFDKALLLNPYDTETISQRSETYLRVKNYDKCLNDALAVLEEDPLHETAVYHKIHSLVGLRQYEDAMSCLQWYTTQGKGQLSLDMKLNLNKLLEKVKLCYLHQKTGHYDFSFITNCQRTYLHECGEYIGPVEIVLFETKGRGTVAKKNIAAGDIIHCTKAFTMGYPDENVNEESTQDFLRTKSEHTITSPFQKLVTTTAQRIMNDPESAKLLYRLYAGPELKWLDSNVDNVSEELLTTVDMKRIEGICTFNAFYGDSGENGENDRCCGIWTISSFINHSCYDANCCWRMYGDLLVVRATKDIVKGQEIMTSYISPCELYPSRQQTFSSYGFTCDCTLCQIDREDSDEIHQKRKHYTKKFNKLDPHDAKVKDTNDVLQVMEYYIEQLIDLRPAHPHMNIYIINPLHQLAMVYYVKNEYSKAANILKHTHEIVSGTVLIESTLSCSINLISCYIRAKNVKKAKKAAKLLENDLYIAYGPSANMEVLTVISHDPELIELMEEYGVTLTFP